MGKQTNAGNYTFGGSAAGSWSKQACCADPRNYCSTFSGGSSFCMDNTASDDFLFGLWRPDQVLRGTARNEGLARFLPTGTGTNYQGVGPDF